MIKFEEWVGRKIKHILTMFPFLFKTGGCLLVLAALSGCADRPTLISIKKAMEVLQQQESMPQVVEVKNMHKLESFIRDGEFVVEVFFEQHFLLNLKQAAQLTQVTIGEHHTDVQAGLVRNQMPSPEVIESILATKYGHFQEGDMRHRYFELIFHKQGGKWLLLERRNHWKDYKPSYFPQR